MGWLVVLMTLLIIVSIVARYQTKQKKLGRHKVKDAEIYDRVERECQESHARQGEFTVDITEISDLGWLDLGSHEFSQEQFDVTVKWRNQGNQCIYKFVASAGEGDHVVTRESKKHIIPLDS